LEFVEYMPNIDRRNEFCCRLPVTTLLFLAQRSRLGFSRYNCRVEIDLEELAEQARKGVVPILEHVLARGVSLYGSDGQGNIIEVAPDGRRYLVRVEGKLARARSRNRRIARIVARGRCDLRRGAAGTPSTTIWGQGRGRRLRGQ
jgi:hypothetical protein